jgi:uroporphyrinogen-III synthase
MFDVVGLAEAGTGDPGQQTRLHLKHRAQSQARDEGVASPVQTHFTANRPASAAERLVRIWREQVAVRRAEINLWRSSELSLRSTFMAENIAPPLTGRRIAITRARDQSSELAGKLAALGAEVIELPLIKVSKQIAKESLADVLLELGGYDWIVFTSANGVRYFFEEFLRIFDDIRALGLLRFACIGDATAKAIREFHLKIECQPKVATAEALADEMIATGSLDSAKVVVITGNLNRDTLVDKLEAAHAIVDQLQVYQTEKTDLTDEPSAAGFRAKGADAILFVSSSAAQSFVDQAAALKLAKDARRPLAGSIGPQTSATMKAAGIPIDFTAKEPGLDSLVEALVKKLK